MSPPLRSDRAAGAGTAGPRRTHSPRQDRGQPRTITPPLAALIERLKRENPHRTVEARFDPANAGEVGSGKSTAAHSFTAALNPNLFKVMYLHWTPGSPFDLFRYAAPQPPRLLELNPQTLRFSSAASTIAASAAPRREGAKEDITQAFAQAGNPARSGLDHSA